MSDTTRKQINLLLFNMVTDADHPVQGFTTAWITALARHCQTIDVISMLTGRLHLPENVRVHSVGKEKGFSELRRAVEFYRHLWSILQYKPIDACFAHMIPLFAVMGFPLLKLRKIPITLWYTHKSVTPLLRLAERLVDRVVTASPESFRIPSSKVIVTGHGIDTDIFVPNTTLHSDKGPFTIVSVGRIAPIKNLEILINAIHILVTGGQVGEIVVRLVGVVYPQDFDFAAELTRQVKEYGLSEVVKWVGPVSHDKVLEEYQGADVVVNLSPTGSFDKAILEAMSCGVPIVTSNVAFKDILSRIDPVLYIHDNDPHELATKLKILRQRDAQEIHTLRRSLREVVVSNHDLRKFAKRLVYEILEKSPLVSNY